jgi:hypothetical protein
MEDLQKPGKAVGHRLDKAGARKAGWLAVAMKAG